MTEEADFKQAYARFVSPAVVPTGPSWPAKKLILLIGLVGGLGMGFGAALLREQFDAGFRTVDQIEERTGLPVLAMVPELKIKERLPHREAMLQHRSAYTESVHLLRTGLQLASARKPFKSLVVTSSVPDEGKSILSATLACISARAGQRILLIDTDLRNPSLTSYFNIRQKHGLVDVLLGNCDLSEAIILDRDSGAFVLPVGSRGFVGGTEVIRSKKMREFMNYAGTYFDQIIFDCAPVLATSEPIVLASAAEATLFVTRWGRTKREVVGTALRQLHKPGIRLLGIVLCRVDMRKQHRYGQTSLIEYYGKY